MNWRNVRHVGFIVLAAVISSALLGYVISRFDSDRVWSIVTQANSGWLLLAIVVALTGQFTAAYRWQGVTRAVPDLKIRYWLAVRAVMVATVLSNILPGKGGDLAKAFFLRRHVGLSAGFGTVVLERLVDFLILSLLGLSGAYYTRLWWGITASLVLLGGTIFAFLGFTLLPTRWIPWEKPKAMTISFRSVFRAWLCKPAAIAQTCIGSLVVWFMLGLTIASLIAALRGGRYFMYGYAIFPLAILAGLTPATVNGIGVRDAIFVLLLKDQIGLEAAGLTGIGYTVIMNWGNTLLATPFVFDEVRVYFKNQRSNLQSDPIERSVSEDSQGAPPEGT
jgi:hypothetical protein